MVMHARKPQRISDGYFEKHQTHPYQKYSNSKSERRSASEYVSSDNRFAPLRSPNGNVSHSHASHAHGHHHYAHLVDDRGYTTSRNSYKSSEKERDRDYKSCRNKYTDGVRSPKEKRSKDCERERSNHERNDSEKKSRTSVLNVSVSRSNKYDKRSAPPSASVPSGSEWSEHISSSGKVYYYNSVSEVSQWDKPRDFDSRRTSSKDSAYSTRSNRDKRSSSRRRESEKCNKRTNRSSDRYWNSSGRDEDAPNRTRSKHNMDSREGKDGQSLQDMDISPDRSTPLSENSYGARETNSSARNNIDNNAVPPVVVLDNSNQPSGSLLAAALPRIVAPAAPVAVAANAAGGVAAAAAPAAPANNGGASPGCEQPPPGVRSRSATPLRDAGPPTPTHSENMDPHAPPLHLEQALPRKMECLGSYSSVVGNTNQSTPMMTASLLNHVRSDLTTHVAGWPADILEKQAYKFGEEAYQLGCLQCTRVSAELKCSRSVVRHTEIQATLQEQKIMYLRQQITRLEELKSQNSFMSED